MEQMIVALVQALLIQGPLGIAVMACTAAMGFCLLMGWHYHRDKVVALEALVRAHRDDKQQLVCLVENNTGAISRNTAAVDQCARSMARCLDLLNLFLTTQPPAGKKTVPLYKERQVGEAGLYNDMNKETNA